MLHKRADLTIGSLHFFTGFYEYLYTYDTLGKKNSNCIIAFQDFSKGILFLERGEGREKERKRNIAVREKHRSVASCMPLTGDLACNPGMCPDWELNRQPFGSQASTQPTEPHQPGQMFLMCC